MVKELNSYEDFKKLSLDEIDEYVDTPGKTTEQMKQFLTWIRRAEKEQQENNPNYLNEEYEYVYESIEGKSKNDDHILMIQ